MGVRAVGWTKGAMLELRSLSGGIIKEGTKETESNESNESND
jgi:hypothetical protein